MTARIITETGSFEILILARALQMSRKSSKSRILFANKGVNASYQIPKIP